MSTLAESLAQMKALEEELKELGVPSESIPTVMQHVDAYAELQAGLESAREKQFEDDAYEMLAKMNAASNKNVERLTKQLRQFAEHVVEHTLRFASSSCDDVQHVADHIPPFYQEEE